MCPSDRPHNRVVPADPPVNVETFATHATATWNAKSLQEFLQTLCGVTVVQPTAQATVDATDSAGRTQTQLPALCSVSDYGSYIYVRVEPDSPWTASWERRTTPTVSLTSSHD